jgi:hypothetical protein
MLLRAGSQAVWQVKSNFNEVEILNNIKPGWTKYQNRIIQLSVKSPSLHPVLGPAFTPYPLFQ